MGREILNRNAHKYEIRVECNVFFTLDNFIIVEGFVIIIIIACFRALFIT